MVSREGLPAGEPLRGCPGGRVELRQRGLVATGGEGDFLELFSGEAGIKSGDDGGRAERDGCGHRDGERATDVCGEGAGAHAVDFDFLHRLADGYGDDGTLVVFDFLDVGFFRNRKASADDTGDGRCAIGGGGDGG